jgi:hypothetical protein
MVANEAKSPMIPINPESPKTSIRIVAIIVAVERPLGCSKDSEVFGSRGDLKE